MEHHGDILGAESCHLLQIQMEMQVRKRSMAQRRPSSLKDLGIYSRERDRFKCQITEMVIEQHLFIMWMGRSTMRSVGRRKSHYWNQYFQLRPLRTYALWLGET